jgi:hypothetical protein
MGVGIIRLDLDGLSEMQHRVRQMAGGRQGVTEIVMRFEKVRLKRNRRTVIRACVFISFQRGEQVSEIVMRTGGAWIDGDRFLELGNRRGAQQPREYTAFAWADAGAALELTGAATGSVTFNGATGTLSLDQSSTFTAHVYGLTGNGNLAASDAIDLKDVKFASATVDPYAGNTAGGTLTVRDTQGHVANISLVGDYTGSSFTLSPDGGGGTIVIDPPLAHAATVAASSGGGVERASGTSLLPQHQAPGQASSDAAGAPNNALTHEAGATRISVAPISATTTATQFDTTTADYRTSREHPVAPGAAIGRPGTAGDRPISSNAGTTSHGIGSLGGALISHASGENAAPINAIAREVVSPNDLISAIKGGNIAIRFGGDEGIAAERQIWLFDDAQGAFVAPASKPLTIVLDHDRAPLSQAQSLDVSVGLLATAAMVSQEPLWLGALRQFGRKAARAIQQRTGWTE